MCQQRETGDKAYPGSNGQEAFPVAVRDEHRCHGSLAGVQNCGHKDESADDKRKREKNEENHPQPMNHTVEFTATIG